MAEVTKIVWNSAGFRQILRSRAVVADLAERGRRIAAAAQAGAPAAADGFGYQTAVGANRVRVTVATETRAGAEAEATDKVLTRAIGAGRG